MTLRQRAALTTSVLLLIGALVLAAADLRVRFEDGVATIGFGPLPAEEDLEGALLRTVDQRLADYQLLLEAGLEAQRQQIQDDWIIYSTEVESGVEGYVLGTLDGLSRVYRADLEGLAERLDVWDLRSARQEQRVDNLTFAVLELSSLPVEPRRILR